FLASIGKLDYPVAIDTTGRVADGYGVQNSPWLTLVSRSGKILWSYDVAETGWPSTAQLVSRVHAALAHAPGHATRVRRATSSRAPRCRSRRDRGRGASRPSRPSRPRSRARSPRSRRRT